MGIIVVHGPQASGKTFHAEAFRKHYGCRRISDGYADGDQGAPQPRDGDLVLTAMTPAQLRTTRNGGIFRGAFKFVSIEDARRAIGVGPVRSLAEWRAQ